MSESTDQGRRPTPEAAPPRLSVRAYLASERLRRRGSAAVKAALDGFWLGLLDGSDLHEIDACYYRAHAEYVDPAYNGRGLLDWESRAVQKHFADRRRLIVTGAGGGREVLALARRGHEVQAFECNPTLLAAGRRLLEQANSPAALALMPRDRWPAEGTAADGIIVGWGSYMLVRGRDRRVSFLAGARAALHPGSPILLSYFLRSRGSTYFRLVARIGSLVARARGSAAPVEIGDELVPSFAHHFTTSEIAQELAAANFDLVESGSGPYGWAVGVAV